MKHHWTQFPTAIAFVFLLSLRFAYAACPPDYAVLIEEGDRFFRKGDLGLAVAKYEAAMTACPDAVLEAQGRMDMITREIDKIRDSAKVQDSLTKSLWQYSVALWDTIVMLQEAISEKIRSIESADSQRTILMTRFLNAQRRIKNLEDSLIIARSPAMTLCKDFVDGKLVYYFIDRNGEEIDSLGRFKEAEQFGKDGFALVRTKKGLLMLNQSTGKQMATSKNQYRRKNRAIDISGTKLKKFRKKIYKMKKLEVLLAARNTIHKVRRRFARLSRLKYLNMEDNELRQIRRFARADSLKIVKFAGNNIHRIPRKIRKLQQLLELDLSNNEIAKIQKQTFQLKSLKVLKLGYNEIESIDESIGQLDSLEVLDLSFNQLTALPDSIIRLKKLKYLAITGNQFISNPQSNLWIQLGSLPSLKLLRFGLNPCSDTDAERQSIRKWALEFLPNCFVVFN